ncbi:hypothetical protein N7454_000204 [Penicillium verhagenii]|nr:hypothetical protein N7454_000204 [Penicillium verhagenii]
MPSSTPDALESDLLSKLSTTSALENLQESLLGSLHRVGWTEQVANLTTELIRTGRCKTFEDLIEAVMASAEGRSHPALGAKKYPPLGDASANGSTKEGKANGTKKGNSDKNSEILPFDPIKFIEEVDVRVPEAVVAEGVRGLRDILREMVDLEDESNGDKK